MKKKHYKILSLSVIVAFLILTLIYQVSRVRVVYHLYEDNINTLIFIRGSHIDEIVDPIREGYLFVGWYKEAEYINQWDFNKDIVYQSSALYAKWERYYDIIFYVDSNFSTPFNTIQLKEGLSLSNEDFPKVSKEGYEFAGWYDEVNNPIQKIESIENISKDFHLFAKFVYK